MGWLFPVLFGLAVLALLWRSGRCSQLALELALAAVLVALAGYGWQGSPSMPGAPVQRHWNLFRFANERADAQDVSARRSARTDIKPPADTRLRFGRAREDARQAR